MRSDALNGHETVRNPRFSRRGLRRLLNSRMWRHVIWFLQNLLRLSSGQKSKPRAEETGSNLGVSPVVHLAMSVPFLFPTATCFSALKTEAADSSEMSVEIYLTTQNHVPGDSNLGSLICPICPSVSSPKLFQEFRLNVCLCTKSYENFICLMQQSSYRFVQRNS
jgi:hypothetical protein